MPAKYKEVRQASVYFPPATYQKLVERSKKNYRSITSEVLAAVEKSLQEAETQERLKEAVGQ